MLTAVVVQLELAPAVPANARGSIQAARTTTGPPGDASDIRHVSEDQRAHPGCVPGGHFLARAARARVRRADALLERFSHVAPGPTSGDHLSAGRRASSGIQAALWSANPAGSGSRDYQTP